MAKTPDAVVRQWFKEVWDEGREEAIDQLADRNAVIHGLGGPGTPPMRGTAEFKKLFQTFREALGDLEIAVEKTVTEGNLCALVIALVRDGKIVEGWNCFDFLSMYQQIGWVKNPPLP